MSSRDLQRRIENLEQNLGAIDHHHVLNSIYSTGRLPTNARERRYALDFLEMLGTAAIRTQGDPLGQREAWWRELLRRADADDRQASELFAEAITRQPQGYGSRDCLWVSFAPPPLDPPI
jgi:hypothetical protein